MKQYEISAWADDVFGESSSNAGIAARANEEMAELLNALTDDDTNVEAGEEIADVFIILCRLATHLGCDINEQVERKMTINRARKWIVTNGRVCHVRDLPARKEALEWLNAALASK